MTMLQAMLRVRHLVFGDSGRLRRRLGLPVYPPYSDDPFLALIRLERPVVFGVLMYGYATLWFTTPFLAASLITSLPADVEHRSHGQPEHDSRGLGGTGT